MATIINLNNSITNAIINNSVYNVHIDNDYRHIDDEDDDGNLTDDSNSVIIAKITAMLVLFCASTFFGFLPYKLSKLLKWNINSSNNSLSDNKTKIIIPLLLSFGGGVLLSTTFLHLLPEVADNIKHLQDEKRLPVLNFHIAEFLMCMGFFSMYLIEELINKYLKYHENLLNTSQTNSINEQDEHHHDDNDHDNINGISINNINDNNLTIITNTDNSNCLNNLNISNSNNSNKNIKIYSHNNKILNNNDNNVIINKKKLLINNDISSNINDSNNSTTISTANLINDNQNGDNLSGDLTQSKISIIDIKTQQQLNNNNNINGHSHQHPHHHHHHHHNHSHIHLPATIINNSNNNKLNDNLIISSLRGLLIVLALSIHELFEGLAIGLESSSKNVWYMFGAVSAHKLVLAFCVGIELIVNKTRLLLIIIYIVIFAIVSPIGIGIGILLSYYNNDDSSSIPSVILQGLATGTLLYVVFFEILTKNGRTGLLQFTIALMGFFIMFGLQFVTGHQHSHGEHGDAHNVEYEEHGEHEHINH